jgi:diketogulonate reductase-like aldo/keto reductase
MDAVDCGDLSIPTLGLGTWQNTGPRVADSVETALELGYRHVDTAAAYDNEAAVGEGIAAAPVDREDIFLTTKVWRSDLRDGDLQAAVRESRRELDVDTLDLVLAHWPHPRVPTEETMNALATVRDDGLTRAIGVSNYTRGQLETARRESDVPIAVNQVLYHPYLDRGELLAYCRDHDIALTAYSPLARGDAVTDERLAAIGEPYDKSAAQVALRWLVQQEQVVAIPKATSRDHLAANLDIFDFSLDDSEMAQIDGMTGSITRRLKDRLPAVMRRFPL